MMTDLDPTSMVFQRKGRSAAQTFVRCCVRTRPARLDQVVAFFSHCSLRSFRVCITAKAFREGLRVPDDDLAMSRPALRADRQDGAGENPVAGANARTRSRILNLNIMCDGEGQEGAFQIGD
mmetsp:Transcript_41863/g.102629  ORF Transcript_41863/g.102629 Transcript_41863/m.102629 type:complete len:122 (+) Transcript_41863:1866-2231(+)